MSEAGNRREAHGRAGRQSAHVRGAPAQVRRSMALLVIVLGSASLAVAGAAHQLAGLSSAVLGGVALVSIGSIMFATIFLRPGSRNVAVPHATGARLAAGTDQDVESEEPVSVDPLTGLLTFQPFSQRLLDEFHLSKRYGGRGVLVLVDLNHLGEINEQFGTEAGDQVLQLLANSMQATKRATDVIARLGDDEFAALLLECNAAGAAAYIDRLQQHLARESVEVRQGERSSSIWVGICAGTAECGPDSADADEILTSAVDSLEQSRAARDRRRERWAHSA